MLLHAQGLSIRYGGTTVLHEASFSIARGEALGIAGESGSGKTQTALAIIGLLPRAARVAGSLRLDGEELVGLPEPAYVRLRGRRIAMVFQNPMSSLNPHLRIGRQLAEVVQAHGALDRATALAESARMLDHVRLDGAAQRLRQYPNELSGGQRQRVLIAMALLGKPDLLIADEPTSALDTTVQAQILVLLAELRAELGMALLLITHDLGVLERLCTQSLVMYRGRVVEAGATARLLAQPSHPYTQTLIASRPRLHACSG